MSATSLVSVRPLLSRAVALLVLGVAAAGCADQATAPTQRPLRLEILSGDQQSGLPGDPLPELVVIRVTAADGTPVEGERVLFAPATGSGRVEVTREVTSATGVAMARWVLGPRGAPQQRLTASVPGRGEVALAASLVPAEQTDLFVADNASGGAVRVVAYRGGSFDAQDHFAASLLDSLPILPFAHPAARDEVAAFGRGRPPLLLSALRWTEGRDTVRLPFRAPVRIPVTLWIVKGPFEQQAAVARAHARAAGEVWEVEGMGVEFSEVEVRDATGHPRAAEFHGMNLTLCSAGVREAIGAVPGRINVYYIGSVATFAGYTCGPDYILMAEQSGRWRQLLTHEIGHTMGLQHDRFGTGNVMNPDPGTRFTEGQLFHAHFQWQSSLNSVYRAHPRELWRECRIRMDGSPLSGAAPCMPASLDVP